MANNFSVFGYEITKKLDKKDDSKSNVKQIITPEDDESTVISTAGRYGTYIDVYSDDIKTAGEKSLIRKYRDAAEHMELDNAINDIVDEAIASLEYGPSVSIVLDELNYNDSLKKKIDTEFKNVVKMLNFSVNGSDMFRKWYIDGRIYIHINVDEKKLDNGIAELTWIDPLKIKKIKEVEEKNDPKTNVIIREVKNEYYIYTPDLNNMSLAYTLAKDSVVCVTSGCFSADGKKIHSHIHKSLKFLNQLRNMEDALVIYRLARAPERRIFYIDTGNLPKGKAEEYIRTIMSKYRNKIVYDANTGAVKDERKHMSMLEDFWLPRREGGKGTEISTLPGGENLGQIEDIEYFRRQLYKSLNIPITRLEPEQAFSSGRSTDISRDEVKFQKFVNRLRKRFSALFLEILRVQLQLKNIVAESDWKDIVENLNVDFIQDNHFYELLKYELIQDRLSILRDLDGFVGKYYSQEWVQKNILKMSDQEIIKQKILIKKEKENSEEEEEE